MQQRHINRHKLFVVADVSPNTTATYSKSPDRFGIV